MTLYQKIGEEFLSKLAESKAVDEKKIARLRALLAENKRLKSADLVQIFAGPDEDEIK
jgi:hypothetical protein